jgi:hypothetical protein
MPTGGYADSTQKWTAIEALKLLEQVDAYGCRWLRIQENMPSRNVDQIRNWWIRYKTGKLKTKRDNPTFKRSVSCQKCKLPREGHVCAQDLSAEQKAQLQTLEAKLTTMIYNNSLHTLSNKKKMPNHIVWVAVPPQKECGTKSDFDMLTEFCDDHASRISTQHSANSAT